MSKKSLSHKLKFDEKIDITNPGKVHQVSFEFSKPYTKDRNVLNVGCWVGNYESLMSGYPRKMIGLEIEKKAIDVAKIYCPKACFVQASILNLPFIDKSFDVVTMWLVLEHLPQGSESLASREVKRILKNNGYFIFSTPNYHWLNNILDPAFLLVNHRHYRKKYLIEMLEQMGFKIEKLQIKGGFFYVCSVIPFYIMKHMFRMRMSKFKYLDKIINNEFRKGGFADTYIVTKKED